MFVAEEEEAPHLEGLRQSRVVRCLFWLPPFAIATNLWAKSADYDACRFIYRTHHSGRKKCL